MHRTRVAHADVRRRGDNTAGFRPARLSRGGHSGWCAVPSGRAEALSFGDGASRAGCSFGHVTTAMTPAEWPMPHRAVASMPFIFRTELTSRVEIWASEPTPPMRVLSRYTQMRLGEEKLSGPRSFSQFARSVCTASRTFW